NHRDNFKSDTDGVSVTGQWANEWLRVGARHARDALDSGLPGSLSAAQYAANPEQATTPDDRASIDNSRSSLFAEARLGSWQLAADIGTRDKQLRSTSAFGLYAYDIEADSHALSARHESGGSSLRNTLQFGTDYNRWERRVIAGGSSLAKHRSRAWYARNEVTLVDTGTALSIGARTEDIDKTFTGTTGLEDSLHAWELGLSQRVGAEVTLYGRIGRSFRLANADEFSFTTPGVALQPQISRDTELGARWQRGTNSVDARLYRSALENEIGYDPAGPGPFGPGANVNFDPTKRQGLELDAAYALFPSLSLRGNLALRESTFRSGPYVGKDVPLAPKQTVSVRADWSPVQGHRLVGGVTRVSSQSPDFANACRMPSYTTADARYALQWGKAELALGVANLFDRKFYTQAFGCTAGVTGSIYPEAGRVVTASLRVSF
ncbi:MAG: TonB-dependent receptor, partial [Haliea sp.]